MNPKINIYVSYHMDFIKIPSPCFIPIQVGAELSPIKLDMLKDNIGENISIKQSRYSDVTSHYYAFKNDLDADYIGFIHYRRMFQFTNNRVPLVITDNVVNDMYGLGLDYESIKNTLKGYDIILPPSITYHEPIYNVLCTHYTKEVIDLYISSITDLFPQYTNALNKFMNGNTGVYYNIFIMKRALFMEYASFKFTSLFELERRIESLNIPDPFPRLFGYLSEFFINFFVNYKNETAHLKTKTLLPFMINPPSNGISSYRLNRFH